MIVPIFSYLEKQLQKQENRKSKTSNKKRLIKQSKKTKQIIVVKTVK